MIRWCSYCYTYLGQTEPLDDMRVTHGMCDDCVETMHVAPPGQTEFFAGLRALSDELGRFASLPAGTDAQVAAYCGRALGLGLKAPEILLSLLQPALYAAGDACANGRVSVAQEHALTDFVERVVAYLRPRAQLTPAPSAPPADILLVAADGNNHVLGLRVMEFLLASEGYHCLVITPGLPVEEVQALALQWRPPLVGFSLALPEQLVSLQRMVEWCRAQAHAPRLVAGGFAFLTPGLQAPDGVTVVSPLLGTRQILQALREAGLPSKA